MAQRHIARDISYATSASTKGGRAVVRLMENMTGRMGLIRRAAGYEKEVEGGRDFWGVMVERYGLTLDVIAGSLENIPSAGPLIVISNHPYGILDGLMLGHILSDQRGDFRILANRVFRKARDLDRVILPISFDKTKEAIQTNLETRRKSLQYLADGGAIGVFPGGTVSTSAKPFSQPMDPGWRSFTARMILKSDAAVVPIFFEGHNSRLFQIASHLHSTLRMGLLIKEFRSRIGEPVRVAIGEPIPRQELNRFSGDSKGMMAFLRAHTYSLSPRRINVDEHGFEFEAKHRD